MDYRGRVKTSLNPEEYSWINYVAYCLYPPLYIAGPIMTFNDFVHQVSCVFVRVRSVDGPSFTGRFQYLSGIAFYTAFAFFAAC